jgi:hypothetical protein
MQNVLVITCRDKYQKNVIWFAAIMQNVFVIFIFFPFSVEHCELSRLFWLNP